MHAGLRCMIRRWMSKGYFTQPIPFTDQDVSKVDTASVSGYQNKLAKYKELEAAALVGGGTRGIERHVTKNRKVLIRERIKNILDQGSPFLEIGKLAGFDMPYGDLPAAGVVAGIGRIQGIYCMISGNDATVKAGTYYPITVKKSGRVQNISEMNRLPVIYMPDSGGAFLPLQSEIFIHGGRGFYNQAVMSAKGIAQIAMVCGSCTAGGAYNPTMSDETIIIDRIGKIFLGGPPLVKAATGEIVTDEDLGGAFMHSSVSGCTDYFATDETGGFKICREIIESLNMRSVPPPNTSSFLEPLADLVWTDLEGKSHFDKVEIYRVLSGLLDGSTFKEFKAFYGPGLITGSGYIEGNMVGIIANAGQILEAEALKAVHFIDMCNRRATPLIFLQNSDATSALANDSFDLKPRGSMSAAVATTCVPKISVTLTGCFHEDYLLMCGPSYNPNLNFAWPGAQFSSFLMDNAGLPDKNGDEEFDAFYAAFNVLTDAIITPEITRMVLGESLRIVKQQSLNLQVTNLQYPVYRM